MNLSPVGRPEGEGGVLLLAGAALSVRQLKKFKKLNPRAGPSRGTWSSLYLQKTESPHAKCVTKEGPRYARIAHFNLFLHPLVRESEDLQLRWHGE
jgi:hypothetical protein